MLQPNTRIHPPLLRPVEMAELLAAVVAYEADVAPPVHLAATHASAAEWCSLDALRAHAVDA